MNVIKRNRKQKESMTGWLFILPSLIGFLLFTLIPVLLSLLLSFTNWNFLSGAGSIHFIGLDNYVKMWDDARFTASLRNNALFTLTVVPSVMLLSLLAAIALNKSAYLKSPIRLMIFMPYISSIVAVSIVWGILLNPSQGPVNALLHSVGIADPPGWLASSAWALPSVILITVWMNIGYNMIIYLAGLQGIPQDLYEASSIDGAGVFRQFRSVTLPMLSSTTFFVMITTIINSFQVFALVFIMTQGGPGTATTVITFYIYQAAFSFYDMGYASAMAWVLFAAILLITWIQWQRQQKWAHE
ncbi:ABC transporter permease [Paenibacillus nasutitermitis]|uniref:ABC transporter permease n=1 Tax=Paenibacillus nasutitermitis TaxID=1652958 RepID=A0A917DP93_9BACL|nr:sugar ABC transporter permease [Paenibacillus nasutitermitis]GGD56102.1 ABC transporter permease [Paenibacillus nasutitermitis]